MPFYVFLGDELLVAYLRLSKIDAAKHSRAVPKLLVGKLRAAWPGGADHDPSCQRRLSLEADAVVRLARHRLCPWPGQEQQAASFGVGRSEPRRQFERTKEPQRLFGLVSFRAKSWDRSRRVILKAEHNAGGLNPRFIVTNVPGDSQELYDDVYCQRGELENPIKEQQLDLFAGRTSCHRFVANAFRLLLRSAAYVLMQVLRREALLGTELEQAQVGTIRLKLLKVAARVVVSARRVMFYLASGYPHQGLLDLVRERLIIPRPRLAAGTG